MFSVKTLQGKIVQFQTGSRHFSILRQFTQHLQKWLQSLLQNVVNQSPVALSPKKVFPSKKLLFGNHTFLFTFAGDENMLGESTYKYLTGDEKTLLEDDSVDVTTDDHGRGGTLPGVS